MKKLLAIFLAALLMLSLVACTESNNPGGSDPANGTNESNVESALELLTTVWDKYADDEKFPAVGGDLSEEHITTDAPGQYNIDDAAILDTMLAFPETSANKIDDAASLGHMMNANTFTCAAFRVTNSADVADVAAAIEDNIMHRHWMCGFPEKLVVVQVDNYLVYFFGAGDLIDTFKTKLVEAYPSAETLCDAPIEI